MQDARVRLVSAAVLSVAAFISIWGAGAVFLWWLVFTPNLRSSRAREVIPAMLALIGIVALLIAFSGGDGLSYFIRMTIVLCICTWLYVEQGPGDFLSVSVWAFGKKIGFDIGMIGECAIQMAESLSYDVSRIQTAMKLKRQSWGIKNLVPAGLVLIYDAVTRAGDLTELLAVRGYSKGGTVCPVFSLRAGDIVAGTCAICVCLVAFLPVSEFFILYR